jgi:hypothetical protein
MMTKQEIIAKYKNENPILRRGSEETGYEKITGDEYDLLIESWADAEIAKIEKAAAEEAAKAEAAAKREAALAKLAALGLDSDDLKALGL